jgi:hypothetical protein
MAVILAFNATRKRTLRSMFECQVIEFPTPAIKVEVEFPNPFTIWRDVLRAWSFPS